MSPTTFAPFGAEHLQGAAQVLERRHHFHQQMVGPLAHEVDFLAQVTSAFQDASGSVALRDGIVVGYLLGKVQSDNGGPHIWSHLAGHGCDDEDLVGDLYALAAKGWVETGLTRHFIFAPAPQESQREQPHLIQSGSILASPSAALRQPMSTRWPA